MKKGNMTTGQAAERLGVTPRRVRAMIAAGKLPARECECGSEWIIKESDLALVSERKPGRPPKYIYGKEEVTGGLKLAEDKDGREICAKCKDVVMSYSETEDYQTGRSWYCANCDLSLSKITPRTLAK